MLYVSCIQTKLEVIKASIAITRNSGVADIPEQGSPSVASQSSNSCVVLGSNQYCSKELVQHPQ